MWRAPGWSLPLLLAVLGMVGPFSIDTYLPAFAGIAGSLQATPVQMQQTLSAYLFAFALMSLLHGALSDSFGRRPVVLWGLAVFTLASVGCALAQDIGQLILWRLLQGLSTGAGIVVSRAVIRDLFPPHRAQKAMSQVMLYFGIAPAVAPLIGGWLFEMAGWRAIFWFLVVVGAVLWTAAFRALPESLPAAQRHPFNASNLMQGYFRLGADPRFLLLALVSGVPFNGMFLYVLGAPAFLGELLHLEPTQFFWLFVLSIGGMMTGSWFSGRLAGRLAPRRQIRRAFLVMGSMAVVNVVANLLLPAHVSWALLPIALYSMGWALLMPAVTLLLLDLHPDRRGMAASLQAFIASTANGLVAGLLVPAVMHSTRNMALASFGLMAVGLAAWLAVRRLWPHTGDGRTS